MKKKEKEKKEERTPDEKEIEPKRKENVRDLLRKFEPDPGHTNLINKERKILTPKRRKMKMMKDDNDEKSKKGNEKVKALALNFSGKTSMDEKSLEGKKR